MYVQYTQESYLKLSADFIRPRQGVDLFRVLLALLLPQSVGRRASLEGRVALAVERPLLAVVLQDLQQRRPESLVEDLPRHLPSKEPAADVGDIGSLPRGGKGRGRRGGLRGHRSKVAGSGSG